MIIVMREGATETEIQDVITRLEEAGVEVHVSQGKFRTILGAIGDEEQVSVIPLTAFSGVEKVMPVLKPYKLVSREFREEDSVIEVGSSSIGGRGFALVAGPCSVETEEQMRAVAKAVAAAGGSFLRGGAYKPRTSPYNFQGLGEAGLELLASVREETGLPIVTEVMDTRQMELVAQYADVLQIGARNMQNFTLLMEAGTMAKPVLLKRGFSNTVEELLMAAEYIARGGNRDIILCERGIRTFETITRNTMDVSAIALLKQLSHLPVLADPSHAAGRTDLIKPLTFAALAAGADGVMIEVHPRPTEALCDGPQSLDLDEFAALAKELASFADFFGRPLEAARGAS